MNARYWFEQYVIQQGYSIERNSDGTYLNITVEFMWAGWQIGHGEGL